VSGRRSRDKGARGERAVVRFLQDNGFAAERVPLSGSAGGRYAGDVTVVVNGADLCVEVKVRSAGFRELYRWHEGRDLLSFVPTGSRPSSSSRCALPSR
jgi:Holliday junction resolvase